MGSIAMLPNQTCQVTVTGADAAVGGNPANLTNLTVDIDNHALAYVLLNSPVTGGSNPTVASVYTRGPEGNFNLLVNGQDANGTAVPESSLAFTVGGGLAKVIILTAGAPFTDVPNTPPVPAGW